MGRDEEEEEKRLKAEGTVSRLWGRKLIIGCREKNLYVNGTASLLSGHWVLLELGMQD